MPAEREIEVEHAVAHDDAAVLPHRLGGLAEVGHLAPVGIVRPAATMRSPVSDLTDSMT